MSIIKLCPLGGFSSLLSCRTLLEWEYNAVAVHFQLYQHTSLNQSYFLSPLAGHREHLVRPQYEPRNTTDMEISAICLCNL